MIVQATAVNIQEAVFHFRAPYTCQEAVCWDGEHNHLDSQQPKQVKLFQNVQAPCTSINGRGGMEAEFYPNIPDAQRKNILWEPLFCNNSVTSSLG